MRDISAAESASSRLEFQRGSYAGLRQRREAGIPLAHGPRECPAGRGSVGNRSGEFDRAFLGASGQDEHAVRLPGRASPPFERSFDGFGDPLVNRAPRS
jgi:hypothetical protein